jgi:glycine hydroxymethyltransferase
MGHVIKQTAPAVTTLGMGVNETKEIAAIMKLVLSNTKPLPDEKKPGEMSKAKYEIVPAARDEAKKRVTALLSRFPIYPELDLSFLKKHFVK